MASSRSKRMDQKNGILKKSFALDHVKKRLDRRSRGRESEHSEHNDDVFKNFSDRTVVQSW